MGSTEGGSDAEDVIPGPALFIKHGDVAYVTLFNNTAFDVGFKIPGLENKNTQKLNLVRYRNIPF